MKHLAMVRINDRRWGFKAVAFVFEGEGTESEAQVFAEGRWSVFFGDWSRRVPNKSHAEVIQIAPIDSHVELEHEE